MIGWYVHHHGRGHLHRAVAVARAMDEPVTGLSSLPRPPDWPRGAPWVELPRDDDVEVPVDPTAGGHLHWVPRGSRGLCERATRISAWLSSASPRLVVVDVSVEVTALVRLHGVPVVSLVLPGRRDDAAHRLGLDLADVLVGMWPPEHTADLLPGLPPQVHARVRAVGALSRHPVASAPGPTGRRRVLVMSGAGGQDLPDHERDALLDRARIATPAWDWQVIGPGSWVEDPVELLRAADVVITHAGQNAVAEVAAARRPALLVPQSRPHDEQRVSADVLGSGPWPARVLDRLPESGWPRLLDEVAALPGEAWARWCDGGAVERFADLLREAA